MKVPEFYQWQFQNLIQREYDEVLKQVEQIIAHHGHGTSEQEEAIEYANFLSDILRSVEHEQGGAINK